MPRSKTSSSISPPQIRQRDTGTDIVTIMVVSTGVDGGIRLESESTILGFDAGISVVDAYEVGFLANSILEWAGHTHPCENASSGPQTTGSLQCVRICHHRLVSCRIRRYLRHGRGHRVERATGIEPALFAWEAKVPPQHFARVAQFITYRYSPNVHIHFSHCLLYTSDAADE